MTMPKDATLINTARPESARGQRRSRFSVGEQTSVTSPMRHARVPRKSRRSPALEALVHARTEQRVYHRERSCGRASSIEKKLTVPAEARSDGEDRNRRSTVHDSRTHLLEPRTHREPDQDPSPSGSDVRDAFAHGDVDDTKKPALIGDGHVFGKKHVACP